MILWFIKQIIWVVLWPVINFLHLIIKSMLFVLLCDSWAKLYKYFSSWHNIYRGFKRDSIRERAFASWFQCFFLLLPWCGCQAVSILAGGHLPSLWYVTGPVADTLQQVSLLSVKKLSGKFPLHHTGKPPFKLFSMQAGDFLTSHINT